MSAAAERQPAVGLGRPGQKALRPKALGVRMPFRVVVHAPCVDQDERPGGNQVRADRERLVQDPPRGHRDRRADAEHLLDERSEVGVIVLSCGDGCASRTAGLCASRAAPQRNRGGRRLVARGDQGQ